ncbi:MAG: patatin-like phospholipase family protein [Azospirillaceae bacterium]
MSGSSTPSPDPASAAPGGRRKTVNLALQGGGAHGAIAWGVLDRLLEADVLDFDGIVGTSAGAMNVAVLAHGLTRGGAAGARAALDRFWHGVAEAARYSPLQPNPVERFLNPGGLDFSPGYWMVEAATRMFSPYQLNPLGLDPLRDLLASIVDFQAIHAACPAKLFISATNVLTGRIRVFREHEVGVDAVMASACLPLLFKAVEVDGEPYWDGGYMGNPPIYPVIYDCDSRDVLIVQINPINIDSVPTTTRGILDRINTLGFNASLMREMRAIEFVTRLIDGGFDDGGRLKRMLIHTIDAEDVTARLGVSSKLNADLDWLLTLRQVGRDRADAFLTAHFDKIGVESSTDIAAKFL